MSDTQPKDKYWICSKCAEAKGWESPDYAITAMQGICGYCESPVATYLIPITDFKRPGKVQSWD